VSFQFLNSAALKAAFTNSNIGSRSKHKLQVCGRLVFFCLTAVVAFAQTPTVSSVLNDGDYSTNLCPGLVVAIYGSNFGPNASAPVKGVTVTVGTKQGYIEYVSSKFMDVQLPVDAPTGPTTIVVTVNSVASSPMNITLNAYAPAFYTADGSGSGAGSVLNSASALLTSAAPANPGDTVTVYVGGLGPTNPPTATGPAAVTASVASLPALTVGGQTATVNSAVALKGFVGLYAVNFVIPAGVQGSAPMQLSIGGVSTNPSSPVTLLVFGISSIVSNASFSSNGTAAACSIASVFGNGFGKASQSVGFPSTAFQGVSVTFNGTAAPLFHLTNTLVSASTAVGSSQIDLLIPCELAASGQVEVAVTNSSAKTPATSPNYMLTLAAGAPGLYFIADPSLKTRFNVIAQFNATAWLAMPASMATALKIPGDCTANNYSPLSECGQPAAPGDYLVLYATGLGLATPGGDPNSQPLTTGTLPPADGSVLYETVATPNVTVGGLPVKVLFSGMAPGFAGLYQIDFQVPVGVTGDDVEVAVSICGSPADTRTVSIQVPTT
jgi:uncharacterized protein (TIGR03437 family)